MRTTLTIDDDVLAAAKGLAERQRSSVGEVISALARQALRPSALPAKTRNGIPILALRQPAAPVYLELVNELRDEVP